MQILFLQEDDNSHHYQRVECEDTTAAFLYSSAVSPNLTHLLLFTSVCCLSINQSPPNAVHSCSYTSHSCYSPHVVSQPDLHTVISLPGLASCQRSALQSWSPLLFFCSTLTSMRQHFNFTSHWASCVLSQRLLHHWPVLLLTLQINQIPT